MVRDTARLVSSHQMGSRAVVFPGPTTMDTIPDKDCTVYMRWLRLGYSQVTVRQSLPEQGQARSHRLLRAAWKPFKPATKNTPPSALPRQAGRRKEVSQAPQVMG